MHRVRGSLLVALAAAACSGGGDAQPDGGPPVDAGPDPEHGACREVGAPVRRVTTLPARVAGTLVDSGADLMSPEQCAAVAAPFGTISAGVDDVIALDGLSPGTAYMVRLESGDDLSFYVVTGCSSETGPTGGECLLFVDETADGVELGRFVAPATTAYVVVDTFTSRDLPSGDFALDVYRAGCDDAADCSGDTPACVDHRCVECVTSFDCHDPTRPVCYSATRTCVPGAGSCAGDDASRENRDDGPAGAIPAPLSTTGRICNDPPEERDYFTFEVGAPGEHWQVALAWPSAADLDLLVHDASGALVGMSRFENPESVLLTYLPVGRYYIGVDWVDAQTSGTAEPYALSAVGVRGDSCRSAADCALEYRNQLPRGECTGGACTRIDGAGKLRVGEVCDSQSDCDDGACASFLFTADADTRSVCGLSCDGDDDCYPMGGEYVCTTYLPDNFCVQRCTRDDHCPTFASVTPSPGEPWCRYRCQDSTGRCVR